MLKECTLLNWLSIRSYSSTSMGLFASQDVVNWLVYYEREKSRVKQLNDEDNTTWNLYFTIESEITVPQPNNLFIHFYFFEL